MEHHRYAFGFGAAVNNFQLAHSVQIVVGIQELMRRVDLDEADTEAYQFVHVALDILRVPRVKRTAGQQPPGSRLAVIGDPRINFGSEAHHLGRDVVDEHGTVDACLIQVLKESFRT